MVLNIAPASGAHEAIADAVRHLAKLGASARVADDLVRAASQTAAPVVRQLDAGGLARVVTVGLRAIAGNLRPVVAPLDLAALGAAALASLPRLAPAPRAATP